MPSAGGVLQQTGVPLDRVAVERAGLWLQPRPVELIRTVGAPRPAKQSEVFVESGAVEAGVGDDGAADRTRTGCGSTARRCRCWPPVRRRR